MYVNLDPQPPCGEGVVWIHEFYFYFIWYAPFLFPLQASSCGSQVWSCHAVLAGDFCLLAHRSGLQLVGTFRLIVTLIMTVCMLNS